MNYSCLSGQRAQCVVIPISMELNHSGHRRELCNGILPTFFQEERDNATHGNKT